MSQDPTALSGNTKSVPSLTVHTIRADSELLTGTDLTPASRYMDFEDVTTLKELIAKTLNDLLQFRHDHSKAEHGSILEAARAQILALCESYDKAALNDAYYKKIEVSAKVLLKDVAIKCIGLDSKVKYKFIETWATQEVHSQDMALMDEPYQNDYKTATALFTLLMAAKIIYLIPTCEAYTKDQSEGAKNCLMTCRHFQKSLMQNWNHTLKSLSLSARTALSVQMLEHGFSKVYSLAELFRRYGLFPAEGAGSQKLAQTSGEPLMEQTRLKTFDSSDLLSKDRLTQPLGDPPSDSVPGRAVAWYTKGVSSFRVKFCVTMSQNRWGPENTSGDNASCGLHAVAQSIAAIEGIVSADVLSELEKVKPEPREGQKEGNFDAEELAVMLEKVRKGYVLGVVSRVHGTPKDYNVYAVWTPSKTDIVNASKKDQVVVWITNNNHIPGSRDAVVVLNHWESFGPNAREVPWFLSHCPHDFKESKESNHPDLLAILEAIIEEQIRQEEHYARIRKKVAAIKPRRERALRQNEDTLISEGLKRIKRENDNEIEDGILMKKVMSKEFTLEDTAESDDEGDLFESHLPGDEGSPYEHPINLLDELD